MVSLLLRPPGLAFHLGPIRSRIQCKDLLIQGQSETVVRRRGPAHVFGLVAEGARTSLEVLSGHGAGVRQRGDETLSLVVRKPERLVSVDWSPGGASESVARVRILGSNLP
jgi:hypothetical protein